MSTDKHFSVLASSHENQQQSGGLFAAEDIRTQIAARNLLVGDVLDGGPPLSLEENLIAQPIRNGRLLDRGSIQERRDPLGQFDLASGDLDGTTQRSNVIWLHERQYKPPYDNVKKAPYMTGNKAAYMLDFVAATKKKRSMDDSRIRRVEELRVWAVDNRTANARFTEAFKEWATQVPAGQSDRTQMDLVRACNLIVGLPEDHEPPYVSQPMISQLLGGKVDASTSAFLDVLAEAMGFRSVWIRTGAGQKKPPNAESILNALRIAGLPIPK